MSIKDSIIENFHKPENGPWTSCFIIPMKPEDWELNKHKFRLPDGSRPVEFNGAIVVLIK